MIDLSYYKYNVAESFLSYVKIDTKSNHEFKTTLSTEKKKNLGKILEEELVKMGLTDAHMDEHCYVYATLPANTTKKVPVICFCSHMDTSPDCSGENVNPVVHTNYKGADIILPNDKTQIIKFSEHVDLKNQIGNDIITTDGTTLLGADNKAGVAEIMDAINYLITHPEINTVLLKFYLHPMKKLGEELIK